LLGLAAHNLHGMRPQDCDGFTLREFVVCLVVAGILIFLMLPIIHTRDDFSGSMGQTFSNMKQLHLATQQMALDGFTTTNASLGWPGDTGGSFSNWAAQLVHGGYLTDDDIFRFLSAPGVTMPPGKLPTTNRTGLLLYSVKDESMGDAVFLSTANFTNTPAGGILDPSAKPFGSKGFVVFRKAGDGAILLPTKVGQTNAIGSFAPLCR
jgi:type II secretory pathway pseudopilin PulG